MRRRLRCPFDPPNLSPATGRPAPALLVLQHQNSHGPLFVRAADWDKMGDEEDPLQGAGGEAPAAAIAAQIVVQDDGAPRVRIAVRINGSPCASVAT